MLDLQLFNDDILIKIIENIDKETIEKIFCFKDMKIIKIFFHHLTFNTISIYDNSTYKYIDSFKIINNEYILVKNMMKHKLFHSVSYYSYGLIKNVYDYEKKYNSKLVCNPLYNFGNNKQCCKCLNSIKDNEYYFNFQTGRQDLSYFEDEITTKKLNEIQTHYRIFIGDKFYFDKLAIIKDYKEKQKQKLKYQYKKTKNKDNIFFYFVKKYEEELKNIDLLLTYEHFNVFFFKLCFQCYEKFIEDEEEPKYIFYNYNIYDIECWDRED
jgi:hypothetical protein